MASPRASTNPEGLVAVTRNVQDLTSVDFEALYNLWKLNFSSNYSLDEFKVKSIGIYDTVVSLHDAVSGTLMGFFTGKIIRNLTYNGRTVTVAQMGETALQEGFKDIDTLKKTAQNFYMKECFRHPFTPLYAVGWMLSYVRYANAVSMHQKDCYPRYDTETPPLAKIILDDFGRRIGGELYDSDTNVIRQEEYQVKDRRKVVSKRALSNPNVNYFIKRNPDWKKGSHAVFGVQYSLE